jgi:hypothetical protein
MNLRMGMAFSIVKSLSLSCIISYECHVPHSSPSIPRTKHLRLPTPVHGPAAISLALLECDHRPPLCLVDRIDISTRFDAHSTPGTACRQAIHLGHVDEFASVELESGLSAECLEVDLGVGVVQADKLVQRFGTAVKLDAGWVVVDDEAVVGLGSFGAEGELFVCVKLRVRLDGTCGDGVVVDDLVKVAGQRHLGAFDRRTAGDVKVAVHEVSAGCAEASNSSIHVPVVGNRDHGLLDLIADQFDLVLNFQAGFLYAVDLLDRWHIPEPQLDSAREALLAVLAQVLEHDTLLSIPVDRCRALEVLLSPSNSTTVQCVRSVVDCQVIALSVEAVDLGA